MAINPETLYPGKIAPSSPEYPYGEARNITVPGDGKGTPWEAALVNDVFGFQQAMLSASEIVPSGNPDKVGASQYLDALRAVASSRATASFDTVANMIAATPLDGSVYSPKLNNILFTEQGATAWKVTNVGADGFRIVDLGGGLSATIVGAILNVNALGMVVGRDNADVIGYLNGSGAVNRKFFVPNGTYDSSIGYIPSGACHIEGESQLGAIINITDSNEDCFTWTKTSGVVKHLTFAGGKNGHVLGDGAGVSTAGRELDMNDILFLNNAQSGRVFNMGWACSYSKIKVFNPGIHADHWRAIGFTNNVMTRGSMRVTGIGDPITVRIDGATLRQCGYDGEIILEGNTNALSVAMKSFAGSLDGFIAKGIYGETHSLGYIDFTASTCHDVEIACNLIGWEPGGGNDTVFGIKDPVGIHIHDSNFTGTIMAPITYVNGCLILNCYARDTAGSYSKNLIYDPLDGDKVKITSSMVFNLTDKMSSALSLPGYFQGGMPTLSAASQHIFGLRSLGYLPDGNDLDHMMHFRKFGVDKYAMETIPLKIIVGHDGANYNIQYAPEGTTLNENTTGNISVILPASTLNNPQTTRFSDVQFVNRRAAGRRSVTATTFVENTDDDTIDIQLYDGAGAATDLVAFEQIHIAVSFVKAS